MGHGAVKNIEIYRYELAILDPATLRWRVFQGFPFASRALYNEVSDSRTHPHWRTSGDILEAVDDILQHDDDVCAYASFVPHEHGSMLTIPAPLGPKRWDEGRELADLDEVWRETLGIVTRTAEEEKVRSASLRAAIEGQGGGSQLSFRDALIIWNSVPILARWDTLGKLAGFQGPRNPVDVMRDVALASSRPNEKRAKGRKKHARWADEAWVAYELRYPSAGTTILDLTIAELTQDQEQFVGAMLPDLEEGPERKLYECYAGIFDALATTVATATARTRACREDTTAFVFVLPVEVFGWPFYVHVIAAPLAADTDAANTARMLLEYLNRSLKENVLPLIRPMLASAITARLAFACGSSALTLQEDLITSEALAAANVHHVNPASRLRSGDGMAFGYVPDPCPKSPSLEGLWYTWRSRKKSAEVDEADPPAGRTLPDSTVSLLAQQAASVAAIAKHVEDSLKVSASVTRAAEMLSNAQPHLTTIHAVMRLDRQIRDQLIEFVRRVRREEDWAQLASVLPPLYARIFTDPKNKAIRDMLVNTVQKTYLSVYHSIGRLFSMRPIKWIYHAGSEPRNRTWNSVQGLTEELEVGLDLTKHLLSSEVGRTEEWNTLSALRLSLRPKASGKLSDDITLLGEYLAFVKTQVNQNIRSTIDGCRFSQDVNTAVEAAKIPETYEALVPTSCNGRLKPDEGCACRDTHHHVLHGDKPDDRKWWFVGPFLAARISALKRRPPLLMSARKHDPAIGTRTHVARITLDNPVAQTTKPDDITSVWRDVEILGVRWEVPSEKVIEFSHSVPADWEGQQ